VVPQVLSLLREVNFNMKEIEITPPTCRIARRRGARTQVPAALAVATAAALALRIVSLGSSPAQASPLTNEARDTFIKTAEQGCFEGQSKQAANKTRKPDDLRRLCNCVAEKTSYIYTMEKLQKEEASNSDLSPDDQRLFNAIFDNCWQANVK